MNKIPVVTGLFFALTLLTNFSQAVEPQDRYPKADFLKTLDKNGDGKASKPEFIAAMEKKFNSMDVDKNEVVSVQELKLYGEKDEESRKKVLQAAKQSLKLEKAISKKAFIKKFTDRAEREFTALDKNHDNELSPEEAGAKKTKKKKKLKSPPRLERNMPKADFVAVFIKNAEQNFSRLDKNRDGKLTDSELGIKSKTPKQPVTAKSSSPPPAAPKPKDADKKAQQQKLIKTFFADIDANNDGQISAKEKNAVFERLFNRLDSNRDNVITQDEIIAGRHTPLANKP